MSAPGLTSEAQLRYLLQWFREFSELQREDFVSILAAARGGQPEQLAATLAALTCQDKPISLFQCRIKLFNEWYPTWAEEDQDRFVKEVSEIDVDFGKKLQEIMTNGLQINGDHNGVNETNSDAHAQDQKDIVENINNVPQESNTVPVEIAAAS